MKTFKCPKCNMPGKVDDKGVIRFECGSYETARREFCSYGEACRELEHRLRLLKDFQEFYVLVATGNDKPSQEYADVYLRAKEVTGWDPADG